MPHPFKPARFISRALAGLLLLVFAGSSFQHEIVEAGHFLSHVLIAHGQGHHHHRKVARVGVAIQPGSDHEHPLLQLIDQDEGSEKPTPAPDPERNDWRKSHDRLEPVALCLTLSPDLPVSVVFPPAPRLSGLASLLLVTPPPEG